MTIVAPHLRIYLSASLFSVAERDYNRRLADLLTNAGHSVFSPQDIDHQAEQPEVFRQNVEGIRSADLVLAVVDGTDVDSGVAWEMGFAYALGIPVIALRTDFRRRSETENASVNLMLYYGANHYLEISDWQADTLLATLAEVAGK